mmetsp:Transcript_15624/g.37917  ORF Transcript_15624/g.37917 Transcript_15624/m.37917 type:complete len:321 (-) Transcript_15624:1238-2200(-)
MPSPLLTWWLARLLGFIIVTQHPGQSTNPNWLPFKHCENPCRNTVSVAPLRCLILPRPVSASTNTRLMPVRVSVRSCSTAATLAAVTAATLPRETTVLGGGGLWTVDASICLSTSIAARNCCFRSFRLTILSATTKAMKARHDAATVASSLSSFSANTFILLSILSLSLCPSAESHLVRHSIMLSESTTLVVPSSGGYAATGWSSSIPSCASITITFIVASGNSSSSLWVSARIEPLIPRCSLHFASAIHPWNDSIVRCPTMPAPGNPSLARSRQACTLFVPGRCVRQPIASVFGTLTNSPVKAAAPSSSCIVVDALVSS